MQTHKMWRGLLALGLVFSAILVKVTTANAASNNAVKGSHSTAADRGDTAKANVETTAEPANVQNVLLMHNAYLYDENGQRANQIILRFGSVLNVSDKVTFNDRAYYVIVDRRADNKKYYVDAENADWITQVVMRKTFIYNKYGQRVKGIKELHRSNRIKTYGNAVKIRGRKYFVVARNRFVRAADVTPIFIQPLVSETGQAGSSTVKKEGTNALAAAKVMHDAYLYNEQGELANSLILAASSIIEPIGIKTVRGRTYYQLSNGLFVAAANIEGQVMKLKHNAYVYDQYGRRLSNSFLKKQRLIRTYGNTVTIMREKYYLISNGTYVKAANFGR